MPIKKKLYYEGPPGTGTEKTNNSPLFFLFVHIIGKK